MEYLQVLRGMFGFFEPREMLRSFAARRIFCLKLAGVSSVMMFHLGNVCRGKQPPRYCTVIGG